MKNFVKGILSCLFACCMLFAVTACNNDSEYVYSLDATSITLEVGETKTLTVTSDPTGSTETATFSSSDTAVASVTEGGTVEGVAAGSATVTVSIDGQTLTCAVTVTEPTGTTYIYSLSATSLTLDIGETSKLTVSSSPSGSTATATFSSSDTSVAEVASDGTVTAKAAGTATITATIDGVNVICNVTVNAIEYTLSQTSASLYVGETLTLTVSSAPEQTLTPAYESADTSVATVSESGVVTAVGAGSTTITVTVDGEELTCDVIVSIDYSYTLSATSVTLDIGETSKLTVSSSPSGSTATATFSSSDTSVAEVAEDGTVTAKAAGTATITTVIDGESLTCTVTVNPYNYTLSDSTLSFKIGEASKLTITSSPEGSTATVTFTSSDSTVAEVAEDGTVTAKGAGTATITATIDGNDLTCTVMVAEPVYTLNQTSVSLYVGNTTTLTVSCDVSVSLTTTFASSDENVATVSEDGTITAVSEGTATITATVNGKALTCAVTVSVKEIDYTYALNNTTLTLDVNGTSTLTVSSSPEGSTATATFSSSDTSVAEVTSEGVVTAKVPGTSTITVSIDGESLTCTVTVNHPTYSISQTSVSDLYVTDTVTLTVTADPTYSFSVTWTSSDESVATVSEEGVVTAVDAGEATITATIAEGYAVTCTVTVNASVTAGTSGVTTADASGTSVSLTDNDDTLDTLYWEHYSENGTNYMMNTTDLITANTITDGNASAFGDYKASLTWTNSGYTTVWTNNTKGLCIGAEITATITVDSSVSAIRVYTGAWRATGVVTLSWNGNVIQTSESFTGTDDSVARVVTFNINVVKATTITITITPSDKGDSGNVSLPAIVVLGTAQNASTASVTMEKTEMTSYNDCHVNLTDVGTSDWFYLSYDKIPDEKSGGTAIDTSSLKVESDSYFWDYKAAFTWTDGTTYTNAPIDNDCDNQGTNNGMCGAYVTITVTVTNGQHVYLWVGGWQSTYYTQVIDSNGNIIANELLHEAESGTTYAYQLDYVVSTTAESETLTFVVYITSGSNCSLAAVAVANATTANE